MRRSPLFILLSAAGVFGCQPDRKQTAPASSTGPSVPGVDTQEPSDTDATGTGADETGIVERTHTVEAGIQGHGSVSPSGAVTVSASSPLVLALAPDDGHALTTVSGTCGGTLEDLQFTTEPVTSDCTVLAVFDAVVPEPAAYCSGIPAEDAEVVLCDPELNLDDWSVGRAYWTTDLRIPSGHVLAMPFTANAAGHWGIVEITNNMPGLNASGFHWHGWFSIVPGGDPVEDNASCRLYSPNPNPQQLKWNQTAPADWECHLGTTERTLYFNMEVRCFEELSDVCTPGERYPDDYWVGVQAVPRE